MSGLKNEPVTSGKFLNFKDGKIISAVDGTKEEFTSVEGLLVELDIVDEEYKGKAYRKVILFIKDDEGTEWKLGFPLESGYGNAFCSLARNINYKLPVKISGGTKEMENEKTYGVLYCRQEIGTDGKWDTVKWFYTKESADVPKGIKSKDRTGEYWDFTERNNFFHKLLIEVIRPAILGNLNGVGKSESAPKVTGKKK